jgi:hypothetical protein
VINIYDCILKKIITKSEGCVEMKLFIINIIAVTINLVKLEGQKKLKKKTKQKNKKSLKNK